MFALLTSSMLLSLGESGVLGTSSALLTLTAAGVPGVLAGRLLDFRWMGSRMDGLSMLLRCILGVSRSSCGRHTPTASYLLQKMQSSGVYSSLTQVDQSEAQS